MNLWIRTQDKTSIRKIDNVSVFNKKVCTSNDVAGITLTLGEYKTEKRALQVLDEIQQLLMPIINVKQPEFKTLEDVYYFVEKQNAEVLKQLDTVIYQMPEE